MRVCRPSLRSSSLGCVSILSICTLGGYLRLAHSSLRSWYANSYLFSCGTAETFAKLINHPDPPGADVTVHDVVEWDSAGQYKHVVDATRKACKGGDVRVYRVQIGGTRVEYFVVGIEREAARLVGVKALAVES
jgi:hypothetical protein